MRSRAAFGILAITTVGACKASLTSAGSAAENARICQGNKSNLVDLLESLPSKGLAVRGRADLPVATLGGVIGGGRVVDITPDALLLDGQALDGATATERIEQLRAGLEDRDGASSSASVPRTLLYLAVPRDTDARTLRGYLSVIPQHFEPHLVFQAPRPPEGKAATPTEPGPTAAERLLSESDLPTRHALARQAYAESTRCTALLAAVDSVGAGDPSQRWPALRSALSSALPSCACHELDAPALRELVLAEQRAGAAAVGALPFGFMRDERCGATFGLTPVQKIVQDIEAFDAEFAGGYGAETLDFEQVVTNDRLLQYLCQALPGETLASLQRVRHTIFWKVRGTEGCQAWQFEPLTPGSPMGTWRRQGTDSEPLAIHYWQGAEEIRLYGPVTDTTSKPTDDREWACNQDFQMRSIDSQAIQLGTGRWFFSEAACQAASDDDAAFPGCIAALAGGPADATLPATFPDAESGGGQETSGP